jgi:hypothetical protein
MAKRVTKKVQQVQEDTITFQEFLSYDQFQQVVEISFMMKPLRIGAYSPLLQGHSHGRKIDGFDDQDYYRRCTISLGSITRSISQVPMEASDVRTGERSDKTTHTTENGREHKNSHKVIK